MFDGILDTLDPETANSLCSLLVDRAKVQMLLSKARQRRIAEASDKVEYAAIDGLGQRTLSIDPTAYHYWGQRLGYDCWNDAQFRREFARDNPEARVKCRGAHRLTVLNRWGKPLNPALN